MLNARERGEAQLIPASRLLRYECPEDRSSMPERGRGHFCAVCDHEVVDMARLTLAEAVDAVREAAPRTCSSYVVHDGALAFRAARLAGGTVVVSIAAFLAACQSNAPSHQAAEAALRAAPSVASSQAAASPASAIAASPSAEASSAPESAASALPTPVASASAACRAKPSPNARASTRVASTPKQPPTGVLMGF